MSRPRGLRLAARVARNAADLVARDAARSWVRNWRTVAPALGTMCLLLTLGGMGALAGLATRQVLAVEAQDASVVHVYLREGVSAVAVDALETRLRDDARVSAVTYVSADQTLSDARRRPGLSQLLIEAGSNPFPASLDITVRRLDDVGAVVGTIGHDAALDPAYPTSYDAGTYRELEQFIAVAGAITGGLLLVVGAVAAAVMANAIRAAILARRDDVTTMQLVGASGWLTRGPFVFEGALTGALAGAVGAAAVLGAFALLQQAGVQTFSDLLPGVGWTAAATCAGLLPAAGIALGGSASLIGMRGLRT